MCYHSTPLGRRGDPYRASIQPASTEIKTMTNNLYPPLKITFGSAEPVQQVAAKPRIPFAGCPLCQSRNSATLRNVDCSHNQGFQRVVPRMMTWLRCNDCFHVHTDGYFPPDVLTTILENRTGVQQPGHEFEQLRIVSARMVAKVAQYVQGGSWLDVGFGSGSLLFTAEEWGFEPVGLDLRRSTADAMQRLGIESHCVEITAVEGQDRFSVISMADVLEHMPFPRDGLAAAHRLLRPDGILFVSMPNYNCAAWRLLDATNGNPYWAELEHYHNFSRTRLYALMKEMGFEPISYGVSERYRLCMEVILRRSG
jgi:SAM-dependent methyltransferase